MSMTSGAWTKSFIAIVICLFQGCDAHPCTPCACIGEVADCSFRNLTYIPALSGEIKILNIAGNIFPTITQNEFTNVLNLSLISLNASHCQISNITSDAFSVFPGLKTLDISNNVLDAAHINTTLKGLQFSNLTYLDISYQKSSLGDLSHVFDYLKETPLGHLYMQGNTLAKTIHGSTFLPLKQIRMIDLSGCQLHNMKMNTTLPLNVLNLKQNKLGEFPNFCIKTESALPELLELNLQANYISDINLKHGCLPNLRKLILSHNSIMVIESNTFYGLQNLQQLYLNPLISYDYTIKPNAFRSKSLLELYITLSVDKEVTSKLSYKTMFSCPALNVLDITNIHLTYVDQNDLTTMFQSLLDLRVLILYGSGLENIPLGISKINNLTNLSLEKNYIGSFKRDIFMNLTSLRHLNLQNNRISVVNESTFPETFLQNIENISLGYNPFTCTCDLYWFIQWIKSNEEKLDVYPHRYKCYSPPHMYGTLLSEYDPSYYHCHPLTDYQITLIAVGAFLFFILTVAVIIKRYRWRFKYYMYILNSKQGYDGVSVGENDFIYDAYVAYCPADRQWVIKHLMPVLEGQEHFKLCLHERDFLPGRTIIEQISETVKRSRKVILILSNNFAESKWCQFEVLMAQTRLLEDGERALVLVSIEKVNRKYMTNCLSMLMKSLTHIEWKGTKNCTKREFCNKLILSLK